MGAAGEQLALHQGQTVFYRQSFVVGNGGPGPRLGLFADVDLLFYLILKEVALQPALLR